MHLRKLVGQTAIYGLSSILGRVLNYLLTPLYTYTFSTGEYGVVSEFYAYAGFISIVLVMGLETGFFRYHTRKAYSGDQVYATAVVTLFIVCTAFAGSVVAWQQPLAAWIHHETHAEYLVWFALILALDTLTALPLARLRAQNRAWRFAAIKLLEIASGLLLNLYFLLYLPEHPLVWAEASLSLTYDPAMGVGYIFLANLAASALRTLVLLPELAFSIKQFKTTVLAALLRYSLPMIVIGTAGMVNEMLDRAILKYLLPYDPATNLQQLGIYAACYKLAMLMTLFVQAFRYAGEPFFFAQAQKANAPILYARVMRYFVLFGVFIFLVVTLYLNAFQYFIGESYRQGLSVVPVLLIANLLLGIHVNLSVWYKLTDKTLMGACIAVFGALITVVLNIVLIPEWGYQGSAWATLACYAVMVLISGGLGHRYYPVPYPVGVILAYFGLGLGLYGINTLPSYQHALPFWGGSVLLLGFLVIVAIFEIKPVRRVLLRF